MRPVPSVRLPVKPGQESVWDYPRPPRLEPTPLRIRVIFAGQVVADSTRCLRLLETSHPPVYYIPPPDVRLALLVPGEGQSFCEFKGTAVYWSIRTNSRVAKNAVWAYPQPEQAYRELKDHLAFYAGRVDACFVGEEQVVPQAGGFYGGWITSHVAGPFKGEPGTYGW